MSAERILVTTSIDGKSRTEIWDTSTPHGLGHPFCWLLERTAGGVVAIDPSRNANRAQVKIQSKQLGVGAFFELPFNNGVENKLGVKLRAIQPPRPAYLTGEEAASQETLPYVLAFSGVRRSVLNCQRIHSAYVAYSRGRPAFTVYHDPEGIRVKPLINGVFIKFKGQAPQRGNIGESWQIPIHQLGNMTLTRGWYWWRFSNILPNRVLSDVQELPRPDDESQWFGKALGIMSGVFTLLTLVIWLWPSPPKPQEAKVVKTQVVTFRMTPQKQTETPAQNPLSFQPIADDHVGPEKSAQPSKKTQVGKMIRSQEKLARQEEGRGKGPSAQALALQKALGGALALTNKDNARKKMSERSPVPNSRVELLDSEKSALAPTQIKPGVVGTQVKVGTIGGASVGEGAGKGKNVGYGTGDKASVQGQGKSFMSMDSGESIVQEGLSKQEVGAVIHNHLGEIRYCYDAAMLRQPKIEGKIVVKFTIAPNGAVKNTVVESSSITEPSLAACIEGRLKKWIFPKPKSGASVIVSYPFLFRTIGSE